jgi:hypothetical protein
VEGESEPIPLHRSWVTATGTAAKPFDGGIEIVWYDGSSLKYFLRSEAKPTLFHHDELVEMVYDPRDVVRMERCQSWASKRDWGFNPVFDNGPVDDWLLSPWHRQSHFGVGYEMMICLTM